MIASNIYIFIFSILFRYISQILCVEIQGCPMHGELTLYISSIIHLFTGCEWNSLFKQRQELA